MKRPVYRKWYDPDGSHDHHYMMIDPSGIMLEIAITTGPLGHDIRIYQSSPINPMDSDIFIKRKERCSKKEWNEIKRKAINYINGLMIKPKRKKK